VHELVVAGPMDLVQAGARGIATGASTLADRAEQHLPQRAAAVVDGLQRATGDTFELADRAIDAVQRLGSPDLAGDVLGDLVDWAFR
jgi:hypothetical protein